MLEEPYRWVEAIRNRREYLEDQLHDASPVVGLTYADGVLLLTTTPGPRKLFEVYNQVAFAAVGHPADIEKLRKAVIDIAHVEGFNLSARDVSLQRLVSFGIGPLMKSAFDEIFRSPFITRVLMAELDPPGGGSAFYAIDADGSFAPAGRVAAVGGTQRSAAGIVARLEQVDGTGLSRAAARSAALDAWAFGRLLADSENEEDPDQTQVEEFLKNALRDFRVEAAILDRSLPTKSKFQLAGPAELEETLLPYTSQD